MTDNGAGQNVPRMLRTHDLVSGENLLIVYFPKAGIVTINGYSVTRSQELEDLDGNAVFRRALEDKLFTIATDILSELYI